MAVLLHALLDRAIIAVVFFVLGVLAGRQLRYAGYIIIDLIRHPTHLRAGNFLCPVCLGGRNIDPLKIEPGNNLCWFCLNAVRTPSGFSAGYIPREYLRQRWSILHWREAIGTTLFRVPRSR